MRTPFLLAALALFFLAPITRADEKKIRLFILSGQSNMVAMDADKHYTPAIKEAFPNDECIVVKHSQGGQPIRFWYKKWKPTEGEKVTKMGKLGHIYDTLMEKVAEQMKDKPTPASVTFVWMQGEADARNKAMYGVYPQSFEGLVAQLKGDLKRDDVDVVIGRLSDYAIKDQERFPGWNPIREFQVKYAESTPQTAWVDCDDLNGPKDDLHYTGAGYRELAKRFAQKSVELIAKRAEPTKK